MSLNTRRTRDDICNKGHSLSDALVQKTDERGEILACRTCKKAIARKQNKQRYHLNDPDWEAVEAAWDELPRVTPIIGVFDINGERWSVFERVDGSRFVIRSYKKEKVEWTEVV